MKNKKYRAIWISIGIIVVMFTAFIAFLSLNNANKSHDKSYTLYTIEPDSAIILKGSVEAREIQTITQLPKYDTVESIHVHNGDSVDVGSLLVTYKNTDLQDSYQEQQRLMAKTERQLADISNDFTLAQEQIRVATNNVETLTNSMQSTNNPKELENINRQLADYQATKQANEAKLDALIQTYKQTQDQLVELQEKVNQLNEKITYTETATISGIVERSLETVPSEKGLGSLLKILSHDVVINGLVGEYDYPKLIIDSEVNITVNSTGEKLKGKIQRVNKTPVTMVNSSPTGIPGGTSSTQYQFIVVPEKPIQYGFSVEMSLTSTNLYIPKTMVQKEDNRCYVYIVEGTVAKKKEVQLEEKEEGYLLKSGLKQGDKIIDTIEGLSDGKAVNIQHD